MESDAVCIVDPNRGATAPLPAVKPLAAGGSKDSHSPPGLQLVMPASEARDHAPGLYRVFDPFNDNYVGFSISEEFARRLIHLGLVECVRTGKRVRGVRPVIVKRPPVKVVEMRGACVGQPSEVGPGWLQGVIPDWCWHEIFYQVMNSVREKPFELWTWDEILKAARLHPKRKSFRAKYAAVRHTKRLRPPLAA